MSYDNTIDLGADTWRHVAFVEQRKPVDDAARVAGAIALATAACRPTRTATACAG